MFRGERCGCSYGHECLVVGALQVYLHLQGAHHKAFRYSMCSTSQRIPHAPACESLVCEVAKRFAVLHKQLIHMLVHGCVGRSETQTIDEGDEGQVCPCWCVQEGSSFPRQDGQSCWKVLLMKFMRG